MTAVIKLLFLLSVWPIQLKNPTANNAEDDAERLGDDAHGLLPALDELAAARPAGRRRALSELRVSVNFDSVQNFRDFLSSPEYTSLLIGLIVTLNEFHIQI
ncbi:hypothetical protein ACJJTC_008607 [Scirpophaga incertulas]